MGAGMQQPNPSDPTLSVTYSELTGQDPESSRVRLQSIQIQFSTENGSKPRQTRDMTQQQVTQKDIVTGIGEPR